MWSLTRADHSDELRSAVCLFSLGLYEQAGARSLAILKESPSDEDALYLLRLVERRLARKPAGLPKLVWQFDPKISWEYDWLRFLLAGAYEEEIVDNTWSHIAPSMIVVDSRLVKEKTSYYRRAFESGARVVLIHLSDETFRDDTGIYRYCDGVLRNYHSELLSDIAHVDFFPLGYKAGFARENIIPRPAAHRKYLWSFAGDAKKLTRPKMLDAMSPLGDGFTRLTRGFGTDDALATDAYRALLDDSVIVPCPCGWANLESFRVYEALEAGCIPIVEKRPSFDYFQRLLGPHPMPTVATWPEAAALVTRLKADGGLEPLRMQCFAWWQDRKPALAQRAVNFVKRSLA